MIFTPWSKKVLPFPSLRHKIQAFQDKRGHQMALPWNTGRTFQFFSPPNMPRNSRKRTPDKIRTRWSDKNRFNPIKTTRPNTPQKRVTELDAIGIDIEAPVPVKVCHKFRLLCSFCDQGTLNPLPQELDWSTEDRDGTKAKRKEKDKRD